MRWLDSIIDSMYMKLSKLWEIKKDREAWSAAVHWVTKSATTLQLNNDNNGLKIKSFCCRGKFKSYKSHLAPLATSPSTSMSSYVPVLVWTDNLRDDLTRVRTCCGSRAHKSPTGAPTSGLGACASRPATVHALHLGSAHGCGAGTRTSRFSPSANLTDYNYALNNG